MFFSDVSGVTFTRVVFYRKHAVILIYTADFINMADEMFSALYARPLVVFTH